MERIHRDPNTIYMLYTGGTTGMPKGVMYKQGEFLVFLFRTLKAMGYEVPEDDDGYIFFVDRMNDVIKRSGENISTIEIENIIINHPDVHCVVV